MRFYHSGTPRNDKYQFLEDSMCPHRLFSLHGDYLKAVRKWMNNLPESRDVREIPRTVLLDSGAFTAWNAGTPAKLEEVIRGYAEILGLAHDKAGKLKFDEVWMINLDVIPGERGRTATIDEILKALEVSDKNLEKLKSEFGSRIMPVFHQDEEEHAPERLELVANQADYICVSPRNDLAEAKRHEWSANIHFLLHEKFPGKKTHGLATTGNVMIKKVPWYSVDSAAWVLHGGMAGKVDVYEPRITEEDEPTYRGYFVALEGGKQETRNIHALSLDRENKDRVIKAIEKYGFTMQQAKADSRVRSLVCMGELSEFFEEAIKFQKKTDHSVDLGLHYEFA